MPAHEDPKSEGPTVQLPLDLLVAWTKAQQLEADLTAARREIAQLKTDRDRYRDASQANLARAQQVEAAALDASQARRKDWPKSDLALVAENRLLREQVQRLQRDLERAAFFVHPAPRVPWLRKQGPQQQASEGVAGVSHERGRAAQ